MNELICCPSCGLKIKLSREYKIELYDYPIKKIIDFLNSNIEEEKKIALKKIVKNNVNYKAEVTTNLSARELKELVNTVMGYCEVCGRSNSSFGENKIPHLYEGSIFAGGIGPTTISYKDKVIIVYDPVTDITVELRVVRGEKE
jgi:hypothetical protein